MRGTADMVVSALVHSPFEDMELNELKRVDERMFGAYIALITHGYTPGELQPLTLTMVQSRYEIENRYCGVK